MDALLQNVDSVAAFARSQTERRHVRFRGLELFGGCDVCPVPSAVRLRTRGAYIVLIGFALDRDQTERLRMILVGQTEVVEDFGRGDRLAADFGVFADALLSSTPVQRGDLIRTFWNCWK